MKRARIGLITFASLSAVGAILMWSGASVEGEGYYPTGPRWFEGGVLMVIGAIGTITSGIMLRVRKRELR